MQSPRILLRGSFAYARLVRTHNISERGQIGIGRRICRTLGQPVLEFRDYWMRRILVYTFNHYDRMDVIRHDHKFVQPDSRVVSRNLSEFGSSDFSDGGQSHSSQANLSKILPKVFGAEGDKIPTRRTVVPGC